MANEAKPSAHVLYWKNPEWIIFCGMNATNLYVPYQKRAAGSTGIGVFGAENFVP
jgi:hypothetical protein